MNDSPLLDPAQVQGRLADCGFGHTVHYYTTVASTMPLAHEFASDSRTPSGVILVAEEQRAGRGRLQRRWETPYGTALLTSIVLKTPHLPDRPTQIPMIASLAIMRALKTFLPDEVAQIGLKWPNDVLMGKDTRRAGKVAGILVETAYSGSVLTHAVVGIGINVNQQRTELPPVGPGAPSPTSLRIASGSVQDRNELLVQLCKQFETLTVSTSPAQIHATWRSALYTLGQRVVIRITDDAEEVQISGTARDVDDDGSLIVEDEQGKCRQISAGDAVSLRMES